MKPIDCIKHWSGSNQTCYNRFRSQINTTVANWL